MLFHVHYLRVDNKACIWRMRCRKNETPVHRPKKSKLSVLFHSGNLVLSMFSQCSLLLIFVRQLPELLFHMEELRGLVFKYSQVIQRYYLQYLSGYDSIALNELIQNLPNVPEDESIILSSFCNSVAELTVDGLGTERGPIYDFRGLRLDWCRLQVRKYHQILIDKPLCSLSQAVLLAFGLFLWSTFLFYNHFFLQNALGLHAVDCFYSLIRHVFMQK